MTNSVLDAGDTAVSETGKVPGAYVLRGDGGGRGGPSRAMCNYGMAEYRPEDGAETDGVGKEVLYNRRDQGGTF